jgi:integrase
MKRKLTEDFVTKAKAVPGDERTIYWDETEPGFGLMVTAAGHRSYVVQYRAGKTSRRLTIKRGLKLTDARKQAKAVLGVVAKGQDPLLEQRKAAAAATNTLKAVAEEYFAREGGRLRTTDERRRTFERLIFPKLGARQIDSIRRSDIVRLLDKIEDESGAPMADHALAYLRRLMSWHAGRSDEFRSPIVRGMARTSPKERVRQRILSDDELRAVWKAAEDSGSVFARLVQFILLTATRRNEAARLGREELSGNEWIIPAARYKGRQDMLVPLTPAALAVLAKVPVLNRRAKGFVFTTDGDRPLGGFSKFKRDFDKRCGVKGWTLHDLRRTARSLMSRAGVPPDHAERALGHVLPGMRGVYDVHEYRDEKRRAFEALAGQIERILNPQDNVVPLRSAIEVAASNAAG